MVCPDILVPFRPEARKRASEGMAAEIVFSGPTYQIRCQDGRDSFWVFLQLDPNDRVKDLFCSCPTCAETGSCLHMAVALFAVFDQTLRPLHKRFESSCFSTIFQALSASCDSLVCARKGDDLQIRCGGELLVLRGPQAWLKTIQTLIESPVEATEETSIKFSEASEEEIEAWRKGSATGHLRYELSAFSDLAKHLFLLSEQSPCLFRFEEDGGLPCRLECTFGTKACSLPVLDQLGAVLETLPPDRTTPSLEFYGGKTIKDVTADTKRRALKVSLEGNDLDLSSAIPVPDSDWFYVSGVNFVKRAPKSSWIVSAPDQVAQILDTIVPSAPPVEAQYHIDVQQNEGLNITPYLRTPGDLDKAIVWGRWVWLKNLGFRRLLPLRFPGFVYTVSIEDLPEFLSANRLWLREMPGFVVHEHPHQEVVTYEVDSNGALIFHATSGREEERSVIELGSWSYIANEGFFVCDGEPPVPYEMPIPPHRVPEFVKREAVWLREIPGFFADRSPITSVGVEVRFVRGEVRLSPRFEWEKPCYASEALLYDDIGYVSTVGFFPLPPILAEQNLNRTYSPQDRESWDLFFLTQLPELQHILPCHVDGRLVPPSSLRLVCDGLEPSEVEQALRTPSAWGAKFYWESELGRVTPDVLVKAYRRNDRFVPTPAGLLDLSQDRFGWLTSIAPRSDKSCRLRTADFLKINAHDQFSFSEGVSSTTSSIIDRLLHAVPSAPPNLSQFASSLRSYQAHGVMWLWYLYSSGLSGLLCDDMGVGKTHQAMALLSAVHTDALANGRPRPRFLILCPASLLWHWKDKLAVSLPHLRAFTYVGGGRSIKEIPEEFDVFLTTYGIWRSESKALHTIPFEVAIFDELQIAKNHVSQIWAALSRVRASMRLGLTGTPVENQFRELKSIFDLVLPGYLPQERLYRSSVPGYEEEGDRRDLLSRYVRPFVLRRRKQDVLPDLPQKTEDIYPIELIGEQKDLYHQVASRQAAPLLQQLHEEGSVIPYMHIFALLSALKQICDHPAVYLKDVANYTCYESGKWDAFIELLEEARESGQKIVVFSQFLSMLDIMGQHLRSNGIGFAEIRGSTKRRGEEIARFQQDPDCLVFLGSLQAAGLGIDLTAGSVVIHYDRWWNAARENQATDRVHRIGQNRGVMVYKLMTSNTVEERIDRMISRKARMLEDVVAYDDHQILKKLDRSELIELLQGLEEES
jgi:superfamily II DNA or RNA helicase